MLNEKTLAPVVIFVYNRLDLTKSTIESLQKNMYANKTELIIYSDSWKNIKDKKAVLEVRNYVKKIKNFSSIKIIERPINYGLAKNIIEGVSEVINTFNKVIVLEDDLVSSKNFLSYMNQALEYYEKSEKIFAISGYTGELPSLNTLVSDVYVASRPSSWGWGTWKNEWDNIDWQLNDYNLFINNKVKQREFNMGGRDMTRMLKNYMEKKNNSWAIRWAYAMFKRNKYCIYPKKTKIQNIGFGNNATHCTGINIYESELDSTGEEKFKFINDININKGIAKEFRYQFSYRNKFIQKYIKRFFK